MLSFISCTQEITRGFQWNSDFRDPTQKTVLNTLVKTYIKVFKTFTIIIIANVQWNVKTYEVVNDRSELLPNRTNTDILEGKKFAEPIPIHTYQYLRYLPILASVVSEGIGSISRSGNSRYRKYLPNRSVRIGSIEYRSFTITKFLSSCCAIIWKGSLFGYCAKEIWNECNNLKSCCCITPTTFKILKWC